VWSVKNVERPKEISDRREDALAWQRSLTSRPEPCDCQRGGGSLERTY